MIHGREGDCLIESGMTSVYIEPKRATIDLYASCCSQNDSGCHLLAIRQIDLQVSWPWGDRDKREEVSDALFQKVAERRDDLVIHCS